MLLYISYFPLLSWERILIELEKLSVILGLAFSWALFQSPFVTDL